jgi:hypothetical protein
VSDHIKRLSLAVALLASGAGCTSWTYEKSGATVAQIQDDSAECQRVANRTSLVSIATLSGDEHVTVPTNELDRSVFNQCMRDRGYSAHVR